MSGWMIFAIVLLVLFLIGQLRVGVRAEYNAEGVFAWARLGPVELRVFPLPAKKEKPPERKKEKPPKKEKPKAEKPKPEEPEKPGAGGPKAEKPEAKTPLSEKVGGAVDYALALLPVALDAAGQFVRKLRIDLLRIELTAGSPDPADAALRYGQAVAVLGAIWGPLTRAFHVRDGEARALVDFTTDRMTVYGAASLSLKLGQIVWLALWAGWRALWAFLRVRRERRAEKKENFSVKV